jgi:hypothetical protein
MHYLIGLEWLRKELPTYDGLGAEHTHPFGMEIILSPLNYSEEMVLMGVESS